MSSRKKDPPSKIKFDYEYSPEYKEVFVTGARGGVVNGYHLHLEFYREKRRLPLQQELNITYDKDSKPKEHEWIDLDDPENPVIKRQFLVALNLPFQAVKELHSYLGERIKEIRIMEKEANKETQNEAESE